MEFQGMHQQELLLNGIGNLERQQMIATDGKSVEGIALRLFNPATRLWSIHWADSRSGVLDPAVVGSFHNKVGHFYTMDKWEGKPLLIKFLWDVNDSVEPQWSQAFSIDGGNTWEWNWYMRFKKIAK